MVKCHGFCISNLDDTPVVGASFECAIGLDGEAGERGQSRSKS